MEVETVNNGAEEYNSLMRPVMITTKLISVWPLEKDSSTTAVFFKGFHVFSMFFLIGLTSIAISADIVHNLEDLDEATECALLSSAFYLSVIRLSVYTVHQKDMLYVLTTMRRDWASADREDRMVLQGKCRFTFRLAKYFIIIVATTVTLFMLISIVDIYVMGTGERIFPFRGYFYANQTASPIFECIYAMNMLAGFFCGGFICGATTFNLVITMHGAAKFAILRRHLEALENTDLDTKAIVGDCVTLHQEAIEFADALERIINVLALGQFGISTGLLCFSGFQITSMMEDHGRLMKHFMFLNSAILELFLFSFSGNRLIEESGSVGDSAYSSDWIGSDFARDLRIMMMRSRNPSVITAAKFYSMSFESFSAVLSTSFSYLTVLLAVNEE